MTRRQVTAIVVAALVASAIALAPAWAIGRGGGGGGRGGGAIQGGGMARPMPSMPRGGANRPAPALPNVSMPSFGGGRPGGAYGGNRPSFNRPQTGGFPAAGGWNGGLKPTSRPQSPSISRPGVRPGNGGGLPTTRPNVSVPTWGGRPGSLPGNAAGKLPGGMAHRPTPLPGSRPGGTGVARPRPGDVNDFLGLQRPAGRPQTLPGTEPGRPVPRPGQIATRPTPLPARPGTKPGLPGRPGGGVATLPWRPDGGSGLSRPPSWAQRPGVGDVGAKWSNLCTRPGLGGDHWFDRHPDRYHHWSNWGNSVRYHWHGQAWGNCFHPSWWGGHGHGCGGWHYMYWSNPYGWQYWWTAPVWTNFATWFAWTAPGEVWSQPVYYDYGRQGNVYVEAGRVFVDGQEVGTLRATSASAAELATVSPPASEETAAAAQWMPLGTFAVSTNRREKEPSRMIQLAVDQQGIVSGTIHNAETDVTRSILGQVDKETQRVAWRISENEDVVMETGLYNLTQDEAPVMVHFGPDKVEYWLLVRLPEPRDEVAP